MIFVTGSDGLFSRRDVKKKEDLILIKYQAQLRSKHNLLCLKKTGVCIVLELIMALGLDVFHVEGENCPIKQRLKFTKFYHLNRKGGDHE